MTTDTTPDIEADITLDELLARVESDEVIEMSEVATGEELTIEHYGRFPPKDLLQNYLDVISTALGDPDEFDQYSIRIDSHKTTVERNDIPVSELWAEYDLISRAQEETLTGKQRAVFDVAATDMDATIAEVAERANVSTGFARMLLVDERPTGGNHSGLEG